jgi:hypothetical protein
MSERWQVLQQVDNTHLEYDDLAVFAQCHTATLIASYELVVIIDALESRKATKLGHTS